jgi:Glycosyl transferase family 90
MENNDAIIQLAQNNAKAFVPLEEEDVQSLGLPYFQVFKDINGNCGYNIRMYNYEDEPNAPRMPYYCDYLLNHIFPNVRSEYDISGFYPIQLHDSYSYLNDDKCYDSVLTFAKRKQDKYPILIPDPFQIGNYGGRLNLKDTLSWTDKMDKIGFYGVTTGNKDPLKNKRLQLCDWSYKNRGISDFYITRIAQIDPSAVVKAYPNFKDIIHNPVSQEEQYKYKCLLSVDGNTSSYDRLLWIMNSRSLAFKYSSDDILWYYELLMDNTHFVSVNTDNIEKKFKFHLNNPGLSQLITANANMFVKNFISPMNTMLYTTYLFENMSENK